jgi:hypothetical protein
VRATTGVEAVGVGLVDGIDFPYYLARGFSQDFVEKETSLCARDEMGELIRDSCGNLSRVHVRQHHCRADRPRPVVLEARKQLESRVCPECEKKGREQALAGVAGAARR